MMAMSMSPTAVLRWRTRLRIGSLGRLARVRRHIVRLACAALLIAAASGCQRPNCFDFCGGSQDFLNATGEPVDLVTPGHIYRLEPNGRIALNFALPRYGDLNKLGLTWRATDTSGNTVFCRRLSYKQMARLPLVEIVKGVNECDE
jgi:hypothetical protein